MPVCVMDVNGMSEMPTIKEYIGNAEELRLTLVGLTNGEQVSISVKVRRISVFDDAMLYGSEFTSVILPMSVHASKQHNACAEFWLGDTRLVIYREKE